MKSQEKQLARALRSYASRRYTGSGRDSWSRPLMFLGVEIALLQNCEGNGDIEGPAIEHDRLRLRQVKVRRDRVVEGAVGCLELSEVADPPRLPIGSVGQVDVDVGRAGDVHILEAQVADSVDICDHHLATAEINRVQPAKLTLSKHLSRGGRRPQ